MLTSFLPIPVHSKCVVPIINYHVGLSDLHLVSESSKYVGYLLSSDFLSTLIDCESKSIDLQLGAPH